MFEHEVEELVEVPPEEEQSTFCKLVDILRIYVCINVCLLSNNLCGPNSQPCC